MTKVEKLIQAKLLELKTSVEGVNFYIKLTKENKKAATTPKAVRKCKKKLRDARKLRMIQNILMDEFVTLSDSISNFRLKNTGVKKLVDNIDGKVLRLSQKSQAGSATPRVKRKYTRRIKPNPVDDNKTA